MDDATRREHESEVMALLEQMIAIIESTQSLIQDDSMISGDSDADGINEGMMKIRALSMEVDNLVKPRFFDEIATAKHGILPKR